MVSRSRAQPIDRAPRHPLYARLYARLSAAAEDRGLGRHRQRLVAGLTGRVLELGAGNGLTFAHYPATVSRVLAVEPEPSLRTLASDAARRAPVAVAVVIAASPPPTAGPRRTVHR